ncbi:MAG: aminodeoxychorismate synthase component I [Sedimentisphaerales bacterium]|nr:aminodeoxychorismate synthase component I [Sedimentisphaerales bacterium]
MLCRLHYNQISKKFDPVELTTVFGGLSGAAILGGNDSSRFSYWMAEPKEIFEFREGEIEPFEKLQKVFNRYELEAAPTDLPKGIFVGGWVGYFAYELGRYIEKVPARAVDDLKMPLIRLCFYDKLIAYDRTENVWWAIALEVEGDSESAINKLSRLQQLCRVDSFTVHAVSALKGQNISALGVGADFKSAQPAKQAKGSYPRLQSWVTVQKENQDPVGAKEPFPCSIARSNMSKPDYLKAIEKIRHYIHEGDVYQINFSHRFECDYTVRPIDLYHWQNEHNPSPYSAYIDGGDFAFVSASPEMFVTISDRVISTKPIKGTRPRLADDVINENNVNELLNCEKEQAELNMIIDLERNDLGRICQYGTINVSQPRTIEAYPTVFHAVATVEGKLRDEITFCDVLRAMFPGGSITGAPKIRSMEIIDELEPTQRGVYTGSIGCIGIDGTVCLNIAIRTVIIHGGKAYAQTGGGIVYDSKPEAEWNETLTKAKALLEGIEAVNKSFEF